MVGGRERCGGFHGVLPWLAHWELTLAIPWHSHGILPWLAHCDLTMAIPWHANGMPHLKRWWRLARWEREGWWIPWSSSMASSLGAYHGHPMAFQWDFSFKEVVEDGVVGERGVVDS